MLNVPLTRQRANLKVRGCTDRHYLITLISNTRVFLGRAELSCAEQHTKHSKEKTSNRVSYLFRTSVYCKPVFRGYSAIECSRE